MTGSDNLSPSAVTLTPIGTIETPWVHPASLPRQPGGAENFAFIRWQVDPGNIDLIFDLNLKQKLALLFRFHKNEKWKPVVQPPRGSSETKKGVFATRAPYRPNQIGLSFVRLIAKNNQGLWISNHDLIHGTPILDIQILQPQSNANDGWIENIEKLKVIFSNIAQEQLSFLELNGEFELRSAIQIWLSNDPLNSKEKRVKQKNHHSGVFSFKTWNIEFSIEANVVRVILITSRYSQSEMNDALDPYKDKSLHAKYLVYFS